MKQALYATTAILGLLALAFLALWPHKAGAVPSPGGEMCAPRVAMEQALASRTFRLPDGVLKTRSGTVVYISSGGRWIRVRIRDDGRACTGGRG